MAALGGAQHAAPQRLYHLLWIEKCFSGVT